MPELWRVAFTSRRGHTHAHQKGIIHRDLKPSNILVTVNDGKPVPKVIDFGVAKAMQSRLTKRTLFTRFEQMIGTPLYMSPEQAEMTSLDIDTRSDIYSLGVLLYELLTGRTPVDRETLERAGFDEIRRIIREQEPPRPSMVLQTMAAATRTAVVGHRHVEPPRLIGLLRGDLDWIVMKSLDKDRNRRYATATALAEDLRRHLDFEPVVARPPSRLYRFCRIAKRNKLAFAAGTAIALALLVGLVVSSVSLAFARNKMEETQAARRSSEEARKTSDKVASFLKETLKSVGPFAAKGRDTTILREVLDKAAARLDTGLDDEPQVEIELRRVIGGVYGDFGDYATVEAMDRRVLTLQRKLFGEENSEIASSLENLAYILSAQGKFAEAEMTGRQALAMQQKLLGDEHSTVASSLHKLGMTLLVQGKSADAEAMHRQALAMNEKLFGKGHPQVASSLEFLATIFIAQGRWAEVETLFRRVIEIKRSAGGDPDTENSLSNLALALRSQGKLKEAETIYRQHLTMERTLRGEEHILLVGPLSNLGYALHEQGKLTEAEMMLRDALAIKRKSLDESHPDVAMSLQEIASVLEDQDKLVEAEAMQRQALAILERLYGEEHPNLCTSFNKLASVFQAQGKLEESETMRRRALAMVKKLWGEEHPYVAVTLGNLASVLLKQDKVAEAEAIGRQALTMETKLQGTEHIDVAKLSAGLAEALSRQKKFTEARPLAEDAAAFFRSHLDWNPKYRRNALRVLDEILVGLEDKTAHESLQREIETLRSEK